MASESEQAGIMATENREGEGIMGKGESQQVNATLQLVAAVERLERLLQDVRNILVQTHAVLVGPVDPALEAAAADDRITKQLEELSWKQKVALGFPPGPIQADSYSTGDRNSYKATASYKTAPFTGPGTW